MQRFEIWNDQVAFSGRIPIWFKYAPAAVSKVFPIFRLIALLAIPIGILTKISLDTFISTLSTKDDPFCSTWSDWCVDTGGWNVHVTLEQSTHSSFRVWYCVRHSSVVHWPHGEISTMRIDSWNLTVLGKNQSMPMYWHEVIISNGWTFSIKISFSKSRPTSTGLCTEWRKYISSEVSFCLTRCFKNAMLFMALAARRARPFVFPAGPLLTSLLVEGAVALFKTVVPPHRGTLRNNWIPQVLNAMVWRTWWCKDTNMRVKSGRQEIGYGFDLVRESFLNLGRPWFLIVTKFQFSLDGLLPKTWRRRWFCYYFCTSKRKISFLSFDGWWLMIDKKKIIGDMIAINLLQQVASCLWRNKRLKDCLRTDFNLKQGR